MQSRNHRMWTSCAATLVACVMAMCAFPGEERGNSSDSIGNSPKLGLVTELGDNQAYHPKVIALQQPLNGYRYWCAFTPYVRGDERRENPCVNVSNDLINWVVPTGLTLPIDRPQVADARHYNSDTHLLFDERTKVLELFWRYVDDDAGSVTIYRSVSRDGIAWGEKTPFLHSPNRKSQDYVSPVVMKSNDVYRIWYVHRKTVWYGELAADAKERKITNPREVCFPYARGLFTWHLDIAQRKDGILEAVAVAYEDVRYREHMRLYYTTSRDNVVWSIPEAIVMPGTRAGAWDGDGLYRSSILEDGGKMFVFYSGYSGRRVGVGLLTGKSVWELKSYK